MVDDEHILGLALDRMGDALSVLWSENQRTQNQKIEGSLKVRGVLPVGAFTDRHSTSFNDALVDIWLTQ